MGSIPIDCVNTQSENGRNLTPKPIIKSVIKVLGYIDLDPASDEIANKTIKASRIYTFDDDGFNKDWSASTVWLNPPGKTVSNGKQVSASQWFAKLHYNWVMGKIGESIGLVYRAGSIGSLGKPLLTDSLVCLTCSDVESSEINGSGRISFDTVDSIGDRHKQTSNTQSSMIFLLSDRVETCIKFTNEFSKYGVIK